MLNILFFFWPCGLWGSFFPDQGLISRPGCESLASKPLDHQEIPWTFLFYTLCLMIRYLSWLVWFYYVLFLKMVMVICLEVCVISDLWLLICEYYQKPRLRKTFLSLLAFLWNSAFRCLYLSFSLLFFSQLFVRPPQRAILLFLHFFPMGMALIPVSCTMSRTSVHSSSGTLSIRSSPLNLFLTSTV